LKFEKKSVSLIIKIKPNVIEGGLLFLSQELRDILWSENWTALDHGES
jgi:hypothetical protein